MAQGRLSNAGTTIHKPQGLAYFICPKCRFRTYVNFSLYRRKAKLLITAGVLLTTLGLAVLVLREMKIKYFDPLWVEIGYIASLAIGFIFFIRGCILFIRLRSQNRKFVQLRESTSLLYLNNVR